MTERKIQSLEEIKKIFLSEFSAINNKFSIIELKYDEVEHSKKEHVWHPGVYVWHDAEKGVLKVGRHFTNSRKRALEHMAANTGGIMEEYGGKPDTNLILFNIKILDEYHWVAAVEVYLEKVLDPLVKSKRQG